jgi:hypothetical protein
MKTKTKTINDNLLSVHPNGKPVTNDKTIYTLLEPSELAYDASVALDKGLEEAFESEVRVSSVLDEEETMEFYMARFTRHASWGLKTELDTDAHGKFALWLEFSRDAY